MEQLRLVDPGPANSGAANSGAEERRPRARSAPTDWRLDPSLRRIGKRKVAEARRVLAEAREDVLARAS